MSIGSVPPDNRQFSYSETFFLRRSSLFVNFLHSLKISSFSMRLSKGNFTQSLKVKQSHRFGNETRHFGNKMGGLAFRFKLSHSNMRKILKHKEIILDGRYERLVNAVNCDKKNGLVSEVENLLILWPVLS